MAKRISGEQGSSNTSIVRQTIETEHDYEAMPGDDLIIVTKPIIITLPKNPYVGEVLQIVADVFKDEHDERSERLLIRGGKHAINGGDIHLRKSSTITLTFTVNREWVPSVERGPRGRRGEEGHHGATGPTGSTGPTGATGPTGGTRGLLQSGFATVDGIITYPAGDQQVLVITPAFSTQAGSFTEVIATFAASSTLAVQTPEIADFFIVIDGVVKRGAEITFVKAPGTATFGLGASGSVSWREVLPAGPHTIELRIISNGDVSISPFLHPHTEHASLTALEMNV